jgi:hypothetical protein
MSAWIGWKKEDGEGMRGKARREKEEETILRYP